MLKFIRYISSFVLVIVCSNIIYADKLEVVVNNREIEFPNAITLKVKISEEAENFSLPNIKDFVVAFKGKQKTKKNEIVYEYKLIPKGIGYFTIPSISYGTESVKPINIKIYNKDDNKKNISSYDNDSSVSANVDTKIVYVNQLLLYKLSFKTRQELAENPTYVLPKFQDFWKKNTTSKSGYILINGENYFTFEITIALYPMRSGLITIDPSEISIKYLGSKNLKVFNTKPISVKVLPLPEIGKPNSFSGAVGRYNIFAKTSKHKVKVKEPFILSVDIKGNGNINSVFEPQIDLPSEMNKYSTNVEINTDTIINLKKFKVNIIPLIEGNTKIPKIYFSYFDTDKNDYTTINTEEINIEVIGNNKENVIVEDQDLNNKELIDINEKEEIYFKEDISLKKYNKQIISNKTVIIFFVVMIILIVLSLIYRLKLYYYYKDQERVKKDEAKKMFVKYLKEAKTFKNDKDKFIYYIDLALKILLRTKINYNCDTTVKMEIKELLYTLNIEESLICKIMELITKIEKYKFTNTDFSSINVTSIEYELLSLKKVLDEKL